MPTLKIDGQEVTAPPGATILQAAAQLGIEIPTFCYHPGLSVAANCRMCLCDTNKSPKPVPSCHAQVMDGMEVQTQSDRIVRTRKAVLEFILLNHPVDCPICDQAGECVLQDHYFKYSAEPSRLVHRKNHKAKAKVLGPDIMLDAERCILCTRCVRFCDEVAKEPQLDVVNRGEHSEITTFPGKVLDNPYAGNVVDICPVGALTSRDFRFRTRVWMLQSERSVCPECARGCSIRVDTFENVPRRYKPVHNPEVNQWWMCDDGRKSYARWLETRMEGPTLVADGKRFATNTQRVLDDAARALGAAPKARVALVVTPWLTNEDAYVVAKLAAGPLAGARVYMGGRQPGIEDAILRRADRNPNRLGVETILAGLGVQVLPLDAYRAAGVDAVVVFGDQIEAGASTLSEIVQAPTRVVVGLFKNVWWDLATHFLPARTHVEKDGTYTNFEGIVQHVRRAVTAASTCKSEGWYALKLGQALGLALDFATPAAIFAALAGSAVVAGGKPNPFAGLDHGALGDFGARLGSGAPAAPAAPAAVGEAAAVGGAR